MKQEIPQKFQIQRRMKKFIVPCDKLSNHPFNIPADAYAFFLQSNTAIKCVEAVKKGKEIITPYWLELAEGYFDLSPLNSFDREVLFACISAFEQGIRVGTISTTLDSLTGGTEKYRVYKEQYAAIKQAIDKLSCTRIKVDLAPLFKAMPKYRANYTGKAELAGMLLPCRYLEAEINGQETLTIELLGESPLMTVAKLKQQVMTYDAAPLAVADQNNTPTVITVKNWLLRRIHSIKRGMNSSILLKTLYAECGLADANNGKKRDVRKVVADILSSFKADGVIQDFEFEKQGNVYRAIKITPTKAKCHT